MDKKPKKMLRGGKGTLASTAEVVLCRNHGSTMKYDPLNMAWLCPEDGCNYRRYKKSEVDQYGPPLICEGPFSLTLYREEDDPTIVPRVLLRGSNNVVVDLSDLARELNVESFVSRGASYHAINLGANAAVGPSGQQYVLDLVFSEVTIVTQAPKP